MSFSIGYSLASAGWSACRVSANGQSCDLTASYLSDALGNLVLSALAAYRGFQSLSFGFDEEPGEYRWVLQRLTGSTFSLQILEFPDLWSRAPDAAGVVLLSTEVSTQAYARAVHGAASQVLSTYGVAGYKEKWIEAAFPEQELSLLSSMLSRHAK